MIAEDPLFWVVSRNSLTQVDNLEIKLPATGSLAVHCNLPDKPSKQPRHDRANQQQLGIPTRFASISRPFPCRIPAKECSNICRLDDIRSSAFSNRETDEQIEDDFRRGLQLVTIVTPSARAVIRFERKTGPSTFRSGTGSGERRFARGDGHNSYLGPGRGTPR